MLSFTLGGQHFAITSLTPQMDEAFLALFAARLSSHALADSDFDDAASTFLQSSPDFRVHDKYFENFTPLWSLYLRSGRVADAMAIWEYALRPVLALEGSGSRRVHKGAAYYFWGMTALLKEDLDLGYMLMHCGVEEDVITHGTKAPSTPGFALVTLDHERPDQAFRAWVQLQAAAVERRLTRYRSRHSRSLDLATLRSKLLCQVAFREAAFIYSYAIARLNRLLVSPHHLWKGPFPAQLAFGIVFDLCLVIEEAIRAKSGSSKSFIHQAAYLAQSAGLPLTLPDLRQLNGLFNAGFDPTLANAVAGKVSLPNGGRSLGALECSLAATYGCRNRAAHTAQPAALDAHSFDALVDAISDTLFLTVETCY